MDILGKVSYFIMNLCCVYSLESPHRGDSNKYTQHLIENWKDSPT